LLIYSNIIPLYSLKFYPFLNIHIFLLNIHYKLMHIPPLSDIVSTKIYLNKISISWIIFSNNSKFNFISLAAFKISLAVKLLNVFSSLITICPDNSQIANWNLIVFSSSFDPVKNTFSYDRININNITYQRFSRPNNSS
jgi:hypothetical protein